MNPSKTENLSFKQKIIIILTHKINDISVKNVKTYKHLGVVLDQNLKFDAFCDLLVKNSFKKWSILKKEL